MLAVQALYQVDLAGVAPAQAVRTAARLAASADGDAPPATAEAEARVSPEVDYALLLARAAWSRRAEVDALIGGTSTHWKVSRLGRIETEVLRVATAEMLECREIPVAVVIDEAIEVARSFAGDEAARFVNGVVDAIARSLAAQGRIEGPARGPAEAAPPAARGSAGPAPDGAPAGSGGARGSGLRPGRRSWNRGSAKRAGSSPGGSRE